MEKRVLGTTGFEITPIGLGTWAIGGGAWAGGWGPQDDQDSKEAIWEALANGVNWVDTAPAYGLGRAESVVGEALDEWGRAGHDAPLVFTKVAIRWKPDRTLYNSLRAASVRSEVEMSLLRLGLDDIDLIQVHWPDPEPEIEEGWETLAALQQEGKVRHLGVSNFNIEQMDRVQRIAPVATLQPPYSLLQRDIEGEILPYCRDRGIGVIVYSPMQSGLLSGGMTRERVATFPEDDHRRNQRDFQEPQLSRNLRIVEELRILAREHGRTVAELAIAWTLASPGVTGAIVGARRPDQIQGWGDAGNWQLDTETLHQIEQICMGP